MSCQRAFEELERRIQRLHATERSDEAALLAAELHASWAGSDDAWVRDRTSFIVEVATIGGMRVVVYEALGVTRRTPCLWVAHALPAHGPPFTIELERTRAGFALMTSRLGVSQRLGPRCLEAPSYERLRPLLFAYIAALAFPVADEHPAAMYCD